MGINQTINALNARINYFFVFLLNKIKDYRNLTIGEQISYPAFGLGLLLVLVSIVLFII